jgi:hypothetical protein
MTVMRNLKRAPLQRPSVAEWRSWAELVQRNLNELDRSTGAGPLGDEEAQSWILVERALRLSSKALEAIQPRAAMR